MFSTIFSYYNLKIDHLLYTTINPSMFLGFNKKRTKKNLTTVLRNKVLKKTGYYSRTEVVYIFFIFTVPHAFLITMKQKACGWSLKIE